jgi:hypothetical protein
VAAANNNNQQQDIGEILHNFRREKENFSSKLSLLKSQLE